MQHRERVFQPLAHTGRIVAYEVPAAAAQSDALQKVHQRIAVQRDSAQPREELQILDGGQLRVELEVWCDQSEVPPPLGRVQPPTFDANVGRAGARSEQSSYNSCQCALARAVGARDDQNLAFACFGAHTGKDYSTPKSAAYIGK